MICNDFIPGNGNRGIEINSMTTLLRVSKFVLGICLIPVNTLTQPLIKFTSTSSIDYSIQPEPAKVSPLKNSQTCITDIFRDRDMSSITKIKSR